MPAVPTGKVLVTGASGFIATQLCHDLVERGYTVVGTVRSPEKGDYLVKLLGCDKFSYVIVADNEAAGAFDEAVKGDFDAVAHTSSPFHGNADDPQEIIGPAVKGTVSVLEAVQKYAPTVKRIVVTSSVAAIISPKDPGTYTFTEADWNDFSPDLVEREGKKAPGMHKYMASKTLAERAAWKFVEDEEKKQNGKLGWDLVTINPPMVYGPTMHQVKSLSAINTSIGVFYSSLSNPDIHNSVEQTSQALYNFVDVRDVSEAHILALEHEQAGGERFIVSKGPYTLQDFYDALNCASVPGVPRGHPDGPKNPRTTQSGEKISKALGLKYHSVEETVVDTVTSLRERFPEETKSKI